MIRVCFVCLGNICRSPTAEGVMRHLIKTQDYERHIEVWSAGTGAWHLGEAPDPRSQATARAHGIKLESRARHFGPEQFDEADVIVAMDKSNFKNLHAIARHELDRSKIVLLRDFDASVPKGSDVPDPYAGGPEGFENVFAMIESACQALLDYLDRDYQL